MIKNQNDISTYRCAQCGKIFKISEIKAGKCLKCYEAFKEKRKKLEKEGFFNNLNRLGKWKVNSSRGKRG